MIARILAFVRLELADGWRRPLPNFMFAILALLTVGLVALVELIAAVRLGRRSQGGRARGVDLGQAVCASDSGV